MNEMNKFSKMYQGNGSLTEEGEKFLAPVRQALKDIFASSEAQEMSEAQFRILGSTLSNIVGNMVCDAVQNKQVIAQQFNDMTDTQFEDYLKFKYEENWLLTSLTPPEFARTMLRSKKDIG